MNPLGNPIKKWLNSGLREVQFSVSVEGNTVQGLLRKENDQIYVGLPIRCFRCSEFIKDLRQAIEGCGYKANIYLN